MGQKVAILGASNKPDRYAYKAFHMLREYGHTTLPVAPALAEIEGVKVYPTLAGVPRPIDTLTMYVGPQRSSEMADAILNLNAKRVIFNPGSENPPLEQRLREAGTEVVVGCTLVMLRTNQF